MSLRLLLLGFALASCSSRSTDTRSTSLPTAKERVAFFCEAVLCPSRPDDAAFHLVHREALFGAGDTTVHAVLKVPTADTAKWSKGCDAGGAEARPAWLKEVLAGTGWKPTTAPDSVRCGQQTRVIHVRDGLVILTDERH
ncbi:MAG: hypothetical protein IT380_06345 [Myxococcales bacterium]|nr:hypothetical protein [Myxococcales bacterium]